MKKFQNGLERPDTFKMGDYSLTDRQEKIMAAALEDVNDSRASTLVKTTRLKYWLKRVWKEGEEYERTKI